MSNNLLESLDKFFKETPKEKIKELWNSGNYLDKGGYKVYDYLKSRDICVVKNKYILGSQSKLGIGILFKKLRGN